MRGANCSTDWSCLPAARKAPQLQRLTTDEPFVYLIPSLSAAFFS